MATYIVTGTYSTRINALGGDSLYVATNAVLGVDDDIAVAAQTANFYAMVSGTVVGSVAAFSLGSGSTSDTMELHIGASGTVSGERAVLVDADDYQIFNAGLISADNAAIMASTSGGLCTIRNSGTIIGDMALFVGGTSSHSILNTGEMTGLDGRAIVLAEGTDLLINGGTIGGIVELGDGSDTYQATGAGVVTGTIYGQAGNDTFRVGSAEEQIHGGDGIDRVINASGQGARMSLGDGSGSGVALGDLYEAVEQLFGSTVGGDQLFGDGNTNWLLGRGGADLLSAGAGRDTLVGGADGDTLTGGADNDSFAFDRASDGGDRIMDFGLGDDVIRVSAAGFGAGLTAGVLAGTRYWANTTGTAHDSDDRFILQTTNKTLWFDPDGSGAAARVLIADLNDNAAFGAGDIFVIA